ncbi:MAG TPA: arylamine N-acetyltransferase [Burkholderiaceae bacterium]|nr:arylamine N-acetyltransferase [Burkholderiaceae bacterium]
MTNPDLDAYFERIGYAGERRPTLDTLRAVQLRHTATIPFENLNPLLRWPVPLDLPSLERKLVRSGRGGYCFEHNLLLRHMLEALGFSVVGLAARVVWNVPEDVVTARSHMLLRVEVDGDSYLVDTGFGVSTPTAPLRLETDSVQSTPHEPFRLLGSGERFVMQAQAHGQWKSLYVFDLQEQFQPDYEVVNWYLSNHPDSHFVKGLIAARPAAGRRYTLRNGDFAVYHLDGETERRTVRDARELRATLEGVFGLTLPVTEELDAALARVLTPVA